MQSGWQSRGACPEANLSPPGSSDLERRDATNACVVHASPNERKQSMALTAKKVARPRVEPREPGPRSRGLRASARRDICGAGGSLPGAVARVLAQIRPRRGSSRPCASASGRQKPRPEAPPPSSSPSPSTLATHQASLAWLASWRPPSKSRNPTSRPTLRKTESTSGACSATKFLSADSSRCGEVGAVVDKRTHFGRKNDEADGLTERQERDEFHRLRGVVDERAEALRPGDDRTPIESDADDQRPRV